MKKAKHTTKKVLYHREQEKKGRDKNYQKKKKKSEHKMTVSTYLSVITLGAPWWYS